MAPSLDDDDFVFTISDNDQVSDGSDIDETRAAISNISGQGKKRKLADDPQETVSKKSKTVKRKEKRDKHVEHAGAVNDQDTERMPRSSDSIDEENEDMASDFEFALGDVGTGLVDDFDGWGKDNGTMTSTANTGTKGSAVDINDIVARRIHRKTAEKRSLTEPEHLEFEGFDDDDELLADDAFGTGAQSDSEVDEDNDDDEASSASESQATGRNGNDSTDDHAESEDDVVAAAVPHPMDLEESTDLDESESEQEDAVEQKKAAAFFAPESSVSVKQKKGSTSSTTSSSFQAMSLSRPILKGLASVGFNEPTPIQKQAIPIAMEGKDVVGGAETGSGKTAAFLIPILERLQHRPKKIPITRVAIFMPTRELAVQCFNVVTKLASFTDITFALMAGGFSSREQEAVLKKRPDVVIATPGRFIDHMHNTAAFQVKHLEILVLDEADRMLEEGFESQLNEVLTTIPKSRQTMLFSATMTSSVDKLIHIGMNKPVRLMVDSKKQTVAGLIQEFVRIRPGKEDRRLAYLMYLCENVYTERVIIFFRQKKEAHRVRVVFALCGLKASELHGNMSQEQRIQAVEAFRSGKSSYLLATDVASRGLDIKNVSTVINYEAPQSHEIYLHRVGRTARAGRSGRACTLAAEADRKVVKQAVKAARNQGAKVANKQIPGEEGDKWTKKLVWLEDELEEVLREEKEERALSITERDLMRGVNLIEHEDEIKSRPKRVWFESERERKAEREKGVAALNNDSGGSVKALKKKRKLSGKEKKKLEAKDMRSEGKLWKKTKRDRGMTTAQAKERQARIKSKSKKIASGAKGQGVGK